MMTKPCRIRARKNLPRTQRRRRSDAGFDLDTISSLLDGQGITANKHDGNEGPVLLLDARRRGASELRLSS